MMKSIKRWFKWPFGTEAKDQRTEDLPEPKLDFRHPAVEPSARRSLVIDLKTLRQLFPIRTLNDDTLKTFVLDRKADIYPPGSILFRSGEPAHSVHYLLEGSVLLETAEGKTYEIQSDSVKARFPLYAGTQYNATAKAKTEIQVLRLSADIMNLSQAQGGAMREIIDPQAEDIPEQVRESHAFKAFCENYLSAEIELPTLPTVAIKLGQLIERDCNLRELARHVQLDPVISSRLLSVANSPLYHAGGPITSCQDAISTLGVAATRNLVMNLCLRRVFESQDPHINKLLREQWKKSVYLSALCYVLASENGGVNREEALLAGLISDIGALPFLCFLGKHPEEHWTPEEIQAALPHIRGPVGNYLLAQWRFPPELAGIPALAEDWYHSGGGTLGLADIVILSKLHAYIGTPRMVELPAINAIPAYAKLKEGKLSPELSLDILVKAKHKIAEALRIFAG